MKLPLSRSFSEATKVRTALAMTCVVSAISAQAQIVPKADNQDDLSLSSAWVNGTVPGANDIARWDATVTGPNATTLGADMSWRGLQLTNPGGAITIGGSNILTLGSGGIDMSATTQDLTINSSLTIGAGNQMWNVASGRTLTLSTGALTRSAGATLNIQGVGTVVGTNMANFGATGILGSWASIGSGVSLSYATKNGSGQIVASAGTLLGAAIGGTNASSNYDINNSTNTMSGGRSMNTLRFIGVGAGRVTNGSGSSDNTLTLNGLMNAGGGHADPEQLNEATVGCYRWHW